jgi:hypothetical protein
VTDTNGIKLAQPGTFTESLEIVRNRAHALLTQAVEVEVADFLSRYAGIGSVAVRQPRVRDRDATDGERIRFSPTILRP